MFAGIIEETGKIIRIEKTGSNKDFYIKSSITPELYIDQSIAHNGVCLTVVSIDNDIYKVTAIHETLEKSNLGSLKVGDLVNLERSITLSSRIDGHHVQGHVDTTAHCVDIQSLDGSWYFTFAYNSVFKQLLVSKGSIAVNGVSLTVVDPTHETFKVAIIPYTYAHTTFKTLKKGQQVNLEFDIIGKYVARNMAFYRK